MMGTNGYKAKVAACFRSERSHAAPRFSNVPPDIRAARISPSFLIPCTWKARSVTSSTYLPIYAVAGTKENPGFTRAASLLPPPR